MPKPDKTDKFNKTEERLAEIQDELNDLQEDLRHTHTLGFSSHIDESKKALFKARLSRIDGVFDKFSLLCKEAKSLARQIEGSDLASYDRMRNEVRERYYEALSFDFQERLSTNTSLDNRSSVGHNFNNSTSVLRLPPINLPSFDGNISHWAVFKDTFISLIHNDRELSCIQKFHYLKSAVKGAAAQVIAPISLSEAEYQHAWETLVKRYDNKRTQATHYLMKIFNFKPIQKQSLNALESFSNVVLENVASFQNLQLEDPAGFILFTYGLTLLDPKTSEQFEGKYSSSPTVPTFKNFHDFVQELCIKLQTKILTSSRGSENSTITYPNRFSKETKRVMMSTSDTPTFKLECFHCKENHRIFHCPHFRAFSVKERYDKIKGLKRCFNCLSSGHRKSNCPSHNSCRYCRQKHHTLLHFTPTNANTSESEQPILKSTSKGSSTPHDTPKRCSTPTTSAASTDTKDAVLSAATEDEFNVLLGTAHARIKDYEGNYCNIRLVIDSGSQRSFITSQCARRLGLPFTQNPNRISGFADSPIPGGKYQVRCTLLPSGNNQTQLETSAVVIPRIIDKLPVYNISPTIKDIFKDYELADPQFYKPSQIEFLLGSDLFSQIFTGQTVHSPAGFPDGLETIFGLVITGPIPSTSSTTYTLFAENKPSESESLNELLLRFWETEEVSQPPRSDPADIECENHFINNHYRNKEGRYTVRLPFKDKIVSLGDSQQIATYRFRRLETKLEKSPDMKAEYSRILRDYETQEIISNAKTQGKYFLPHHGVFKNETPKKLRIVFDASSTTSQGSLNDKLLTGPKLQSDIREVLLKFRLTKFVLIADIQQMFLQILVHPDDQDYLHFLYRFDHTEALKEFQFNRLPFGLSCSPFLAIRVLKQLVNDEGNKFPLASKVLTNNSYVDDILAGADTHDEICQLQQELTFLLRKGGFELKKWASNCPVLLDKLYNTSETSLVSLANLEEPSVKVLGMQWSNQEDCLSYQVNVPELVTTKRKIMSVIARIYDPLGYLSPAIFKAKTILQDLWRRNLDWDASIPTSLAAEWNKFMSQLPTLQKIKIPRYLFPATVMECKIRVIGFADASILGYASVIYLRCENDNGSIITSQIIFAKTRLAPTKTMTIPRLELCAAVLLINCLKTLKNFLDPLKVASTTLLSDSAIVLSWLRTPPYKLKTFVANRVVAILEASTPDQWYHVQSSDNIADVASRGIEPQLLIEQEDWWKGPDWLLKPSEQWPISNQLHSLKSEQIPEVKEVVLLSSSPEELPLVLRIIDKYSTFSKVVNIFAYILRFAQNTRIPPEKRKKSSTSIEERNGAIRILVKATQNYYFREEYPFTAIKSLAIKSLNPFLDSFGVVRVGGRLENSLLSYEQKHPILLPQKAHFTKLLIEYWHYCHLHAGPQLLHSLLRSQFWILSARKAIKSCIRKCSRCQRWNSKPFQPIMGNLPSSRFSQGRAFLNTGVDFAGPFSIRDSSRRKYNATKCYVCLYICFGTKAVHLEVVSAMTTEAFLASLDRFIARRGLPSHIYSDNGRNFLGASNHLKELYAWWKTIENQNKIDEYLKAREIKWGFIPPHAPHFGGLWEAGIKSFKYHLHRVLTSTPLTFEEFTTITSRIEAILNSRPLYPISSSPEDFEVLTPGYFLIGAPMLSLPEYNFMDTPTNRLSRWQFLRQCIQDIWRRWRKDYLHHLQQRVKWTSHKSGTDLGSLVLLQEPNAPPQDWPTARVIAVIPGKDGVVRVVRLRTAKGEITRAVSRLVPLSLPDD